MKDRDRNDRSPRDKKQRPFSRDDRKPRRSDTPEGERAERKPRRFDDKADKPRGERKPWDKKDRPFTKDGDRKPRRFDEKDGERADRKPRRFDDKADKPRGERKPWDKKDRPFTKDGDRKPRRFDEKDGERADRKPRRFDDKADKPRGERKPWDKKDRPFTKDGDRKPRRFEEKDGERAERKPRRFDDRTEKPSRSGDKRERPARDDNAPLSTISISTPTKHFFRPETEAGRKRSQQPKPAPRKDSAKRPTNRPTQEPNQPTRIAKRISDAGICSRRDAEKLVAEGRVRVNGKTIDTPAIIVTLKDRVEIDGHLISNRPPEERLFLYHKPRGQVVTARDPEGRPTVFDALPEDLPRLIAVGRLDLDSEGLLLLTNSGALSRHLELPATGLARTYRVRLLGTPSPEEIERLARGITVDGVRYDRIDIEIEPTEAEGRNRWCRVTLYEGKNREIRRVFDHLGYAVSRLQRVSYGPFTLGKLPQGTLLEIKPKDWQKSLDRS